MGWQVLNRGYKHHVISTDGDAFGIEVCGADHAANAHLIAAAPDLLAALDEIFNGAGMTGPTMDAARAAIAKAKGN
jgi:hypothetical protein